MSNYKELLTLPENLIWAWRKAKAMYRAFDALHDQAAVSAFELNLDIELSRLKKSFEVGTYRTQPLRLLPQPKRPDASGKPRMRQSFQVSVRDQVAWIAVTNVIGPSLDQLMPAWSYGHRLYRTAWYEEGEHESKLNIGPYRHTTPYLIVALNTAGPCFVGTFR